MQCELSHLSFTLAHFLHVQIFSFYGIVMVRLLDIVGIQN